MHILHSLLYCSLICLAGGSTWLDTRYLLLAGCGSAFRIGAFWMSGAERLSAN